MSRYAQPAYNPITRAVYSPLFSPLDTSSEGAGSGTLIGSLGSTLEALGYTGSYWYPGGYSGATLAGGLAWGTMYQDSTGATPVTALEQSVGFRTDRRYLENPTIGANVVSGITATYTGSSAAAGSAHRIYSPAGAASAVEFASTLTVGQFYLVTFTIDSITTAGGGLLIGTAGATILASGAVTVTRGFVATATTASIGRVSGVTDIQISGVSFQAVTLPASAYGADVVVNGTFATDTVWTKGTGWAISGGIATHSGAPSGDLVQAGILTSGKTYEITCTTTVGAVTTILAGTNSAATTAAGVFRCSIVANGADLTIRSAVAGATVDTVVCRELKGTHLTQATSTARGTLGARYNLLTYSQQFDNVAWSRTATAITTDAAAGPFAGTYATLLVPDGTNALHRTFQSVITTAVGITCTVVAKPAGMSWIYIRLLDSVSALKHAYFNITTGVLGTVDSGLTATITAASNGYYICKATITTALAGSNAVVVGITTADNASSSTGDSVNGIYLYGVDIRFAAYSAQSLPYYQRIGSGAATVWDYDTTGPMADGSTGTFPVYIRAQTDDSYSTTRTMDFSGTDEMYVSAGVLKYANGTMHMESSLSSGANAGTNWLFLGNAAGASAEFVSFRSRGTGTGTSEVASVAPAAVAVTGYGDISADTALTVANGVSGTAATDQGTGNYGNHTWYVYSRAGSSLFANVNGYYELAVDARATSAASRAALTSQLARDLMKLSY